MRDPGGTSARPQLCLVPASLPEPPCGRPGPAGPASARAVGGGGTRGLCWHTWASLPAVGFTTRLPSAPRSVFTPRPLPAALYKGTPQFLTAGNKPAGPSAACGNSPSPFSARIIFVFFDTQPSYGYRKEIDWFSKPKFFFCSSGLQKKKKNIPLLSIRVPGYLCGWRATHFLVHLLYAPKVSPEEVAIMSSSQD